MKAEEVSLGSVEGFRKMLYDIGKNLAESHEPIQQYKTEMSHRLDILALAKISPDFRLGKDDDGAFVDAYTQEDEMRKRKFGYTRVYENRTVIFNALSMIGAKKRARYFINWLREKGFLIPDEN